MDTSTPLGLVYVYATARHDGYTHGVGYWGAAGNAVNAGHAMFTDRETAIRFATGEAEHLGFKLEVLPSVVRVNV